MKRYLLILLLVFPVQAATYYVATTGSNSYTKTQAQSISTPWLTIQKAADNVTSGDTVLVRGGTYYEEVTMKSDGVTFQAYTGETPIVDGSVALGTLQALTSSTDFVDHDGDPIAVTGNAQYANIYKITYPESYTALDSTHMLIEDGVILAASSTPEQTGDVFDDISTYTAVDASCYGNTTTVITSGLTEPDNFWNGAKIKVYVTNNNNNTTTRTVTAWDVDTQTFTLSGALPATLSSGDSYKLENHWACITRAGEMYHTTTPKDGYHTAYIWPRDSGDLNSFRIARHDCGWNLANGNDDNLIIDGFTIRNFCGAYADTSFAIGRAAATTATMDNTIIRNCTIENIEGKMGIILGNPKGVVIDTCTLNNIRTGWGIFCRGLSTNRGTDVLLKDCQVNYCRGTNYKFTETDYGQLQNCIIGTSGTHGDGVSVYENCTNIGIFHCQSLESAIAVAYQGVTNLYVVGNDCQTDMYSMAHWSDSTGGNMYFLHNTCVPMEGETDLYYGAGFQLAADGSPGTYVVKNNIFWSTASQTTVNSYYSSMVHQYNCFLQATEHWTASTGEIESTTATDLFTDWTTRNLTVKDTSADIYQTGTDVDAYLDEIEAVYSARGATYAIDLSVDRYGTAWATTPSMGAYEYTSPAPAAPTAATTPTPADSATDVVVDSAMTWVDGGEADTFDVYLSLDNTFTVGELIADDTATLSVTPARVYSTTYYWRVDASNSYGSTTGSTWSFETEAAPVDPPLPPTKSTIGLPANAATAQLITVDVSWTDGGGATSYDVYFGTDATPDETESIGNQATISYEPGTLGYNTTYYWRIDAVNATGTTTGDTWSFTTESLDYNTPTTVRLIPFLYSTEDTYVLELTPTKMKFYREGGTIQQ